MNKELIMQNYIKSNNLNIDFIKSYNNSINEIELFMQKLSDKENIKKFKFLNDVEKNNFIMNNLNFNSIVNNYLNNFSLSDINKIELKFYLYAYMFYNIIKKYDDFYIDDFYFKQLNIDFLILEEHAKDIDFYILNYLLQELIILENELILKTDNYFYIYYSLYKYDLNYISNYFICLNLIYKQLINNKLSDKVKYLLFDTNNGFIKYMFLSDDNKKCMCSYFYERDLKNIPSFILNEIDLIIKLYNKYDIRFIYISKNNIVF